ncbi:MAG: carbohydrate ABC transporter permease [Acutalibacteraceae bacterium]
MKRSNSSKYTHSTFGNIIIMLFLTVFAFLMMVPMIYTVCTAFKPSDELFKFPPSIFVTNPTIMNFYSLSSLLKESWVPFSRYIFNSVFISGVGTAGNVILSSLAAYRIAKFDFPGKKVYFQIVTMSLMFSAAVTAIPNFIIMTRLNMVDTYWAIIIPACGSSLGLFLMKQFMEQMVPDALIEAAQIDGASEWCIFSKIVMPVVKPAWLTLIIFSFKDIWNNNGANLIFSENIKPLPSALSNIVAGGVARAGASAAVALILLIPPVLVFIFSQSNVLETMSTSGMKD